MFLWSAFIMGLVGNFHCLGMCGPIALAIPVNHLNGFTRLLSSLLYNGGRIASYAVIGALFGLFGKGLNLMGFQQSISLILGIVIVVGVLFPLVLKKIRVLQTPFVWVTKLKQFFPKLLHKRTYGAIFLIGLLNGLLPCGLVYMAVAGAIASGSWIHGMNFMILFGLGTLPLMFALPFAGQLISQRTRNGMRKLVPVFVVVFGCLLILRGANLGIPYVSPQAQTGKTCCHLTCH